ncbi:MAG TPA: sigma factor [Gallionella sp.]|nr:sigma factor [Gallionella sp.]
MTIFAYPETGALYETISVSGGQPFRHGQDADGMALMQRIKAGDPDARQKLIIGNLRHVLHSNRRYARSGAGIFDLLKAGDRGLAHALDSFETKGDGSFPAYAATCIRQQIERALDLAPADGKKPGHARHLGRASQHQAAAHSTSDSCQN